SEHLRAHDYAGRRCQWGTTPGRQFLYQEILGPLCAPGHHGRRWAQSASRSTPGLYPGCHRCRRVLDVDIMSCDGYVREIGGLPRQTTHLKLPQKRRTVLQSQTHETTPAIRPFRINVPEEDLVELRRR